MGETILLGDEKIASIRELSGSWVDAYLKGWIELNRKAYIGETEEEGIKFSYEAKATISLTLIGIDPIKKQSYELEHSGYKIEASYPKYHKVKDGVTAFIEEKRERYEYWKQYLINQFRKALSISSHADDITIKIDKGIILRVSKIKMEDVDCEEAIEIRNGKDEIAEVFEESL